MNVKEKIEKTLVADPWIKDDAIEFIAGMKSAGMSVAQTTAFLDCAIEALRNYDPEPDALGEGEEYGIAFTDAETGELVDVEHICVVNRSSYPAIPAALLESFGQLWSLQHPKTAFVIRD